MDMTGYKVRPGDEKLVMIMRVDRKVNDVHIDVLLCPNGRIAAERLAKVGALLAREPMLSLADQGLARSFLSRLLTHPKLAIASADPAQPSRPPFVVNTL